MVRRQGKAINKTTRGLMIIFDLDGVLADCAHRRHFVDSDIAFARKMEDGRYYVNDDIDGYPIIREWKPDWQAYHEACDKDELIKPVCYVLNSFMVDTQNVEVWTSRSESVRKKTEEWFEKHIRHPYLGWNFKLVLKMRPIGNTEPIEVLKEGWLDMRWAEQNTGNSFACDPKIHCIDMVFDAHPESIAMWKRRGVFVFDCRQTNE